MLRFEVLGEVKVFRGEAELHIGWPRQRSVLAILLLHAGRVVGQEAIINALWEVPPRAARNVIHTYVSKLRRVLDPQHRHRQADGLLARTSAGYSIRVEPGLLDLNLFTNHLQQARRLATQGDLNAAVKAFDSAFELWRGTPLTGVLGPLAAVERVRLRNLRFDAIEQQAEALLGLGESTRVADALSAFIVEDPLRERLYGLRMTALYRAARKADALAVYRQLRSLMIAELAIEPCQELQKLHRAILNDEQIVVQQRTPRAEPVSPQQLPRDVPTFTGRQAELAQMDMILAEASGKAPTVVVSAMSGTAGVGKTALAVRWAHRVTDRFPDGQLYVNLRGFDPSGAAMDPAEALHGFLEALGVAASTIPAGTQDRATLYRSLVAGRRLLVLLDNARDAEQVRPLLPASAGCAVVVTSRNQLTSLVALEGAHPLQLDVLTWEDARALLRRRIGEQRVANAPDAADEIIDRCARLPLAIAITSAQIVTRPEPMMSPIAEQLHRVRGRLDLLKAGDEASDMRAVLSWSYDALDPAVARLFRLLGLHPGPDISATAAASVAGLELSTATSLLEKLCAANFVVKDRAGRFAFHDLLRAYAMDRTECCDSTQERQAAITRALDHYLHTAYAAAVLFEPNRDPIVLPKLSPRVALQHPTTRTEALAWLNAEHAVLLGAVQLAAAAGYDTHSWQLVWAVSDFLERHGHWHDQLTAAHAGLVAATRLHDPFIRARAHRLVARAATALASYDEAHHHLQLALQLSIQAGDRAAQAHTFQNLARVRDRQDNHGDALTYARKAHELYLDSGHHKGQAYALNAIGWYQIKLGSYPQALESCQQALEIHQRLNDHFAAAAALDSIGFAYHHLGQYEQAVANYQAALATFREINDRHNEAITLDHLGDAHYAAGHPAATALWQQALAILDELEHPEAQAVRGKLAR